MLCEAQTNFAKSTQVLEEKIEDKSVFLSIIQCSGTATGSTNTGQNGGKSGTVGGQDVPGTDTITSLAKLQSNLPQRNRTNQNDGSIHVLCSV